MENIKNIALTVLAAGVVGGILLVGAPAPVVQVVENGRVVEQSFGSVGPTVPHQLHVMGALQWGSGTFATTSTGASTLAWADIDQVSAINRAGVALTMTLPASTTVAGLPNSGDCRNFFIENTGTGILTFAAGTGINLRSASTTLVGIGLDTVAIGGSAIQTWCRESDTDITVVHTAAF